jgi:hypothetical protein
MVAESIPTLQKQLDFLASVVLQNWQGLDLLTAEKGGLCLFLQEECCFYVNQSGVVKNKIRQLQEQLEKWRRELEESWSPLGNNIYNGSPG